jgi:hypothetical protein
MFYLGRTRVMTVMLALVLTLSNISVAADLKGPPGLILWAGGHANSSVSCRKPGTNVTTFNDNILTAQNLYYLVYQQDQGGILRVQRAFDDFTFAEPAASHVIALDEECFIVSIPVPPGVQVMKPMYTFYTTTDTWSSGSQYLWVTIGDYLEQSKLFQLMQPIIAGAQTQILYIFQINNNSSSSAMIVPPNSPTGIPDAFKHTNCRVTQC